MIPLHDWVSAYRDSAEANLGFLVANKADALHTARLAAEAHCGIRIGKIRDSPFRDSLDIAEGPLQHCDPATMLVGVHPGVVVVRDLAAGVVVLESHSSISETVRRLEEEKLGETYRSEGGAEVAAAVQVDAGLAVRVAAISFLRDKVDKSAADRKNGAEHIDEGGH